MEIQCGKCSKPSLLPSPFFLGGGLVTQMLCTKKVVDISISPNPGSCMRRFPNNQGLRTWWIRALTGLLSLLPMDLAEMWFHDRSSARPMHENFLSWKSRQFTNQNLPCKLCKSALTRRARIGHEEAQLHRPEAIFGPSTCP